MLKKGEVVLSMLLRREEVGESVRIEGRLGCCCCFAVEAWREVLSVWLL